MDKKWILREIARKGTGPLTIRGLARLLSVPRKERETFKRLVKEMVREGSLVRIRGNRYGLPLKMNLVIGRLEGHPDGYGFVIPEEGGRDVYVSPKGMGGAMDGDRVVVRVEKTRKDGKREGSIVRILERKNRELVGIFEREAGLGLVVPVNERISCDLIIPPGKGKAPRGKVVVAEILQYPAPHRPPTGRIIEVLGDLEDPWVGVEVIIRKYGLPRRFDDNVKREAEGIPEKVRKRDIAERRDLRALTTFTIDGEEAKDFDDAVSIERLKDGYRLYVSIADVSHYVPEGSNLDIEAYNRGTSVYFPGMVIPMLPEELSNGICSLKPGVDRLAFTVMMEFSNRGRVRKVEFFESVIRSDERLTYTRVKGMLVDKDPSLLKEYRSLLPDLKAMERLCRILRKRRLEKGSIDFDLPEAGVVLDLTGKVENIVREERNIAHFIIEEFMLAANRAVATAMAEARRPFLYRIHEPPEEEEMLSFGEILKGLRCPYRIDGVPSPKTLQKVLTYLEGRPEERMVNHLLLRSMKQARYSEENVGHYALAFPVYTHFTSPIRRYPDLVVHRLLKAHLKGASREVWQGWKERLPEIAIHTSRRERVAMEAEREVLDLKKVDFMKERVGEVFKGIVSGIASFGVFVELEDYPIEGMVHLSTIPDDYYIFDEKRHILKGERTRKTFRIGDRVKVLVERVDLLRKRIDFTLFKT